ncbi:TVP38/TMEM64 family protein [Streptococcus pluranimalium]|uniref:TVP38/TMEM64 family protein n=2 Tax=Streptococcus pluranimalium TaxID=82348 RepID=UPI002415383C|nr:VTT domain-containing protein [Streptococcus pluranimalium]MDY3042690.1 VTT domain-containing protein [Streptococcus pluranimalium]WFM80459.1 VTT domain-containing protein [Streptococcus pluranimalium]HEM6115920.1 TVP38/TMEM64 family protein [Streptococcus suis]
MSSHKRTTRSLVKVLSTIILILSWIFVYFLVVNLDIIDNPDALQKLISKDLVLGAILFFGLQVLQVLIAPIPGGIITVVGILAFGPVFGFLLDYLGILLGSLLLFRLVRTYGRSAVYLMISEEKLSVYEERFFGNYFHKLVTIVMLAPIGPADITVMLAGLSKISEKKMMTILALCRPVSIISYSLFWIYGSYWLERFFGF